MSYGIRQLPATDTRVETGPVQFGDDWPGVFIRGDAAAHMAHLLGAVLDGRSSTLSPLDLVILIGLYDTLRGCVVGPATSFFPERPLPTLQPPGAG